MGCPAVASDSDSGSLTPIGGSRGIGAGRSPGRGGLRGLGSLWPWMGGRGDGDVGDSRGVGR